MAMLPQLHPRQLVDQNFTTIGQLRLVSKAVGNLAMTAVQYCLVNLGEGTPSSSPLQLIKLMVGAQLEQLKVCLTATPGECCCVSEA